MKNILLNDKNYLISLINEGKSCNEILNILKVSKRTLYNYLNKFGLSIPNYHNSLKFDNSVFDNIDTEEKAYWLGFLYADGFINGKYNNSVELSLFGEDIEHLRKYNNFLKNKLEVKLYSNGNYTRCRCIVTNKHFHDRLIELGCIPNKSLVLKFPNKNIFKTPDLIRHFIRGYIDGDGCLTNTSSTRRLRIEILGTQDFLIEIINLFPNIFSKLYEAKNSGNNIRRIICENDKADIFAEFLYSNSTIYLERKYLKFAQLCKKNS